MTLILLFSSNIIVFCQTSKISKWVDTEEKYADKSGNVVFITNSLPKGGGVYTDAEGKVYSYVVFWTQIINKADKAAEFLMEFPIGDINIFSNPNAHIKLFLPTETMTLDKIPLFDYGLTYLPQLLEAGINKVARLQQTIMPGHDFLFYSVVLFYQERGATRASFVLKDQQLFFNIRMSPDFDPSLIPCGHLIYKN